MITINKIYNTEDFLHVRQELKVTGKRLVFTNGCFDILHVGHVDYLEKARELGDFLVVALNTDSSVRLLKGDSRPVNTLHARQRLIAALGFVDAVLSFSEQTPKQLIENLIPDILVKGADYQVADIIGADTVLSNGGEVKTIDLVDGYSTTGLIERMK